MMTVRMSNLVLLGAFLVGIATAFIVASIGAPDRAEAQSAPETVLLAVEKKFSGSQEGFVESDFSYQVTGDGVDVTVPHNGTVPLSSGTYTIEEIVPNGFVKEDWRIGWYGSCDAGSEYTTTITINDGNIDDGTLACQADNQYRPEDDGTSTTTSATLTVVKVVVNNNGGTSTPDLFSFSVNGGAAVAFESDGTNVLTVATGTYAVSESAVSGYSTSYDSCANIVLEAGEQATCTITNDDTSDGGGGGGDKQYRIEGYVWHDSDEDAVREDEEPDLTSWTVTAVNINNESESFSTTTDSTGYYYFDLDPGTWRISEVLQEGWTLVAPGTNNGVYIVTVPMDEEEPELSSLWFPFNLLVQIAHAAIVDTYSGFDFGNNFGGGNGGDGDGDGGGGGGGERISLSDSDDGGSSTDIDGRIAGAQTSALPLGAANAGDGGSSSSFALVLLAGAAISAGAAYRLLRAS